MKNTLFALALLSFSALADQERILVSDIDDTIKVSHVLDKHSTVLNVPFKKNAFMGMAQLYKKVLEDKKADQVVYLSNAPKFLMTGFHGRFLKKNGFPEGRLLLPKGLSIKNHKVESLRKIIKNENPKELILVGDNGERDTLIYAQIRKEFPNLKMTTYIHLVYSLTGFDGNVGKKLEENQIGYATSMDLAVQMKSREQLGQGSYEAFVKDIVDDALAEGEDEERGLVMMFPNWVDCRDLSRPIFPLVTGSEADVLQFELKLADRCQREPFDS